MKAQELQQTLQSLPFNVQLTQQLLVKNVNICWQNEQINQSIKVLSHPMSNQKDCIALIHYLLKYQSSANNQINLIMIVNSIDRRDFLIQLAKTIKKIFIEQTNERKTIISSKYVSKSQAKVSQLIFMTFKQFVRQDLNGQHIYDGVLIETSNFLKMVRDGFYDYITDTYLRRSYIQALRFQQAYRQANRQADRFKSIRPISLNKKKTDELQLINVISSTSNKQIKQLSKQPSKHQQKQKDQQKQRNSYQINNLQNIKTIRKAFDKKKQQLIKNDKNIDPDLQIFQDNQLILISSIIYIIGYFSIQFQTKKYKNIQQFITDFINKTLLPQVFLQKIMIYYQKIYKNCPIKIYPKFQQTYLYSICQFINKIITYRKIFFDDYQNLFQVRVQKFPIDKRQSLIQQSTSCISINIKDNRIFTKLFKKKSTNTLIIQNLACPQQYWHYIFKKNNILINPISIQQKYSKIYGLQISKTPSNQYINFAQKLKADQQTIKFKVCGVLLYDLSKFIPDGIIVYFHSMQGLQTFNKQMAHDDQKILKRIDNNKKIFYQSAFQQQNNINFAKFKKCCEIGRGAIFFLVANGKAAQYLKFYGHLSRCIVFFGLPKRQNQYRRQTQAVYQNQQQQQKQTLQTIQNNIQRIGIFNQCINNCINNLQQYRSIIFVGMEISNDLQNWYRSFIRSWGQTTRDSLSLLRQHFQKMSKSGIW